MQCHDEMEGIGKSNRWDFFGGGVEEGEALTDALERALQKEPGCSTGQIGKELFRWDRCPKGILNVSFPVRFTMSNDDPGLMENKSFAWLTLDELVDMPLSSLVYENMFYLLRIAAKVDTASVTRLEQALLRHGKLRKKNDRVFYARETPAVLGMQFIMLMKALAELRELPVFRVCLHAHDDEGIHEMLMVHTRPVHIGPLKQNKASLSYHMLDGVADISLYDDAGVRNWTVRIDSKEDACARFVRLNANVFRSIQTISQHSIFLEVANGPFADSDTVWLDTKG